MCKVHFDPDVYKPFVVDLYHGDTKPENVEAYLNKFIAEVSTLQNDGISISDRNFQVKIKCFIYDTPARAFLKCTIGHTGFNACERCTVQGYKEGATTIFPIVYSAERTDASFRGTTQPTHHNDVTALLRILAISISNHAV